MVQIWVINNTEVKQDEKVRRISHLNKCNLVVLTKLIGFGYLKN